jgi:hypothetical protein
MPRKFFWLVLRSLSRSQTRLLAAVGGCAVGSFMVCFFIAAQGSLNRILESADADQNLIVTQRDRF